MSQQKPLKKLSPLKRLQRRSSLLKVEDPPIEVEQFTKYVKAELRSFKKAPHLVSLKHIKFLIDELSRCVNLLNPNQRDYNTNKAVIASQISQLQNYLKNYSPEESSSAHGISQDIIKVKELDTKRDESTIVTLDNVDPVENTSLTGFNLSILTDNNFVTPVNSKETECGEVPKNVVPCEILSFRNNDHNYASVHLDCSNVKSKSVETPQKRKRIECVDDRPNNVSAANLEGYFSKNIVVSQDDMFESQRINDESVLGPVLGYEDNPLFENNRLPQDDRMDEDIESVDFLEPSTSKSAHDQLNPGNDYNTCIDEELSLDIANISLNKDKEAIETTHDPGVKEANEGNEGTGVEKADDDFAKFLEKVEKLNVSMDFKKNFKQIVHEEIFPLFKLIKEDLWKSIDSIDEKHEASMDKKGDKKKKAKINPFCFKEEDLLNLEEDESTSETSEDDIEKLHEEFLEEFGHSFALQENVEMDELPDWRNL